MDFFFILGFPLASQHKMSENKVECQAKGKINFEPTDSEMAQKSDEDSNPFTTDNEVEDELETDDNFEEK